MKILIINEFIQMGGTEVQSEREWKFFREKGHETFLLTFDPKFPAINEGGKINLPLKMPNVLKAIHRLTFSNKYYKLIKRTISTINPDVIHLNHTINLPHEVFKVVEDYPTFQTIRDYGAVCPKLTCIDKYNKVCNGYKYSNCRKCMGYGINACFRRIYMYEYNRIRQKGVRYFVSPSGELAKCCTANGISTTCVNNPFDFSICLNDQKKINGEKKYLYYGIIYENKGINELFDSFEVFSREKNVELLFAGKIRDDYKEEFNRRINDASYAEYLGVLPYKKVMELYREIYCVVVPSKWLENYPNTVLEAIANKTLVIGSNRGGIPEMIEDETLLFNIDSKQDIITTLEFTYKLNKDEYQEITIRKYSKSLKRNSMETYYTKIMELYEKMLAEKINEKGFV